MQSDVQASVFQSNRNAPGSIGDAGSRVCSKTVNELGIQVLDVFKFETQTFFQENDRHGVKGKVSMQ